MKEKVGLFGGSFNPFHIGHLNSLRTVLKREGFSKIYVVPNNKNPLKDESPSLASSDQRLQMVKLGLKDDADKFIVDDAEVKRGGKSYTIETLREYAEKFGSENLYLIMGADAFNDFDRWKNYEEILSLSNILVTTRPHSRLPLELGDFSPGIQRFIDEYDLKGFAQLTTGRHIYFLRLDDVDVSASMVRKKIRTGKNVDKYLTFEVEEYIRDNEIYVPEGSIIEDYQRFAQFCANCLFEKKAIDVKAFDLSMLDLPSEYTVIASGTSRKHASSLAEYVMEQVKDEFGIRPISVEGLEEGRWVLLDYGSLIVHVFYDYVRNEYSLEELWEKGRNLNLRDPYAQQA